jgi:CRISPR-associated endonuclease/helicase Cas3
MDLMPMQADLARFRQAFGPLQGKDPFPWQERLFREFVAGRIPLALDLPTGLGKTSVMALWLIARGLADDGVRGRLPRRLAYVVDRRAVVDQASAEAEKIRSGLKQSGLDLKRLGLGNVELPISTLRGQHIDNRDWLANPTASAIIVGTVDMIGSRLLFSGYGVSTKMRPYHAGLLGADTLVVLDEAHLVPPFEALLKVIAGDNRNFGPRSEEDRKIIPPFRVLSLSATGREDTNTQDKAGIGGACEAAFRLDEDDRRHPVVAKRIGASKKLTIHDTFNGKASLVDELAKHAWQLGAGDTPSRVLVYCNSRLDALKVKAEIEKHANKAGHTMELLVGQRRVHERDELFDWFDKNGFTGGSEERPPAKPTFLIATAAGEVGVDLDADHMVCDLVEWERMVQRLGRVNRRGWKQSRIEVVALPTKDSRTGDETWEQRLTRLRAPLELLPVLDDGTRDASPRAILTLKADPGAALKVREAQSEEPLRPALTRALVDAWSMTSLETHAGRPDVQPWLRGWEYKEQQSVVVWREHLPVCVQAERDVQVAKDEINDFFENAPPHLSESLEAETWQVAEWLFKRIKAATAAIEKRKEAREAMPLGHGSPVLFVLDSRDELVPDGVWNIGELAGLDRKERERDKKAFIGRLGGRTLIVSKSLGGLKDGMLNDDECGDPVTMDTAKDWGLRPFRVRKTNDPKPIREPGWRPSHRFACEIGVDQEPMRWLVVDEFKAEAGSEESRALSSCEQTLSDHGQATRNIAHRLTKAVGLPNDYVEVLALAARLHDEGKDFWRWQRAFNAPRGAVYAKTRGPANLKLLDGYRHEFGSLIKIEGNAEFQRLPSDQQDLLLHLVAAHHGNARPLISARNAEGAGVTPEARTLEVALRFERLQRRWGPWGLAWWESLLRAADQGASRENDEPSVAVTRSTEPAEMA